MNNYKLILLNNEYYLLSDEEPEDRHLCMGFHNETMKPSVDIYYQEDSHCYKYKPMSILASTNTKINDREKLPMLDGDEIKDLISGVKQIEELALLKYPVHHELGTPKWMDSNLVFRNIWIEGYTQAIKDKKFEKFSLKQNYFLNRINQENLSRWDVEIKLEASKYKTDINDSGIYELIYEEFNPKITEGYITITKIKK